MKAIKEIATRTVFGVSFGDNTYKVLGEIALDPEGWFNPAVEKIVIRTVEIIVYDFKDSNGDPIAQTGWFHAANSYYKDLPSPPGTGNPYMFCVVEAGSYHNINPFPGGTGMSFPKHPTDEPTFRLMGYIPNVIDEFTYFMTITYTREELPS